MPPTVPPDWKSAVEALTGDAPADQTLPAIAGPDDARTAMGLLFELREQTPRSNDRWRGATAVRASASRAGAGAIRLGVRPVILSDSGKWVKSTITWSNVGYQLNRLGLNVEQHRWFCQFVPLHRVDRPVYNGQDTEWLYLDEFESPLLWHLLTEANRLGIALVGSHKDAAVTVAGTATVALDAVRTAEALTLSPVLSIDGQGHPVDAAGALGDHGVYAYRLGADAAIVLAPSIEPLSTEQRRLLGSPGGRTPATPDLVVPAGEVDEFLRAYYPALRRSLPIESADASIQFPPPPPPVLVHTVSFQPKQAVRLDWQWQGDRDDEAEDDVLHRLNTALPDLSAPADPAAPAVTLTGLPAAEYTDKTLPRLETIAGVWVQLVGEKPDYRELTATPQLIVTTVETEKRDWFDLGVIVRIDGRSIPFNPIFTALAKGRKKLLLVDNSYLSLTQPVFDRLRELIEEARALSEWETGLRINRHQASLWSDFEDLADETEQAVSWRAAVGGLLQLERGQANAEGVAALPRATPLPAGLNATLRPYQRAGYEWLVFLWEHGLGGILADDMGLGKTLQVLALLSHAVQHPADPVAPARPFLVVAPTSVVANWLAEAAKFTPGLRVGSVTSTQATSGRPLADQARNVDVLVTSYALFRLDFDAYQAHGWAGLILDEAQFVKNRTSQVYRSAVYIDVPFTLAVTGTPVENNLLELWALFSIVAPGLFPSARRFTEEYLRPAERGVRSQAELIGRLRRRIRPLMLRRTKDVVARDLPAKQEQVLRIDLDPEHREIYDTFLQRERQKLLGLMDDLEANRFIVFRSITLLRMLSLDASLVDDQYAGVPSSKLDALFEQLDEVVAEGHRALIFSQFTSYLALAAARLDARGVRYSYLDGSTTDRPGVIDEFKTGDAPVFLISLKAGGFGLNLTEADYVFLLDPWWNPASESQAIDRTHRIGQTRNVMVYRLVAADTIEEKVMALKESKAKLVEAVLDDEAVFAKTLTADDIRALLE
ncbi:DEAD/DEAH box helicase [Cryobacterium lactosi]|uniref:DEAD/DEAH box helicase n=1 Tax=Cryobacterium lactosi TaxID=1259202 RepID=A0A4R9BNC7_9MICO|nr:DEAD/DEAH box helicase [Cryobacterium lactosi]TFD87961.1 DEAD/DEAH box helicase [Cryobacterium lactosi]